MNLLSQATAVKLLGRALTTAEDTNFDLYLKIATSRLEDLLCMDICGDDGERTYETRYGYSEVYVDPFTDITSVTIDGDEVDAADYITKQNERLNANWYNVIEFDSKRRGEKIVVDADWGFDSVPADLQLLLAKLFAQGSIEQTSDNTVQSKRIEDFTVTYKDSANFDQFVLANQSVIDKYAQCNRGAIRHGYTRWGYNDLRSIRSY